MIRAESDIDRSRLPIKVMYVNKSTVGHFGTLNRRCQRCQRRFNVVNVDSTLSTSIQLSFDIISTVIQYVLASK